MDKLTEFNKELEELLKKYGFKLGVEQKIVIVPTEEKK